MEENEVNEDNIGVASIDNNGNPVVEEQMEEDDDPEEVEAVLFTKIRDMERRMEEDSHNDHQDREYQTFLVDLAKKRNIIVCLPTGSGKTFIALRLAKDYLHEAVTKNKKIVFLANTVPLVNQQAEYFRKQLCNSFLEKHHVECLTGECQVDFWQPAKWAAVIRGCHVMVMTTQIFVDALGHGYMKFSDVIFLILDECHHTDKDAPMNKVMEEYRRILSLNKFKLNLEELPRLLGLTATIINGKGKGVLVSEEVKKAEERLCARAVTYHNYEEVLKYSTNCTVEYAVFNSTPNSNWNSEWVTSLQHFQTVIAQNEKAPVFQEKKPDIEHHTFKSDEQLFNNKETEMKKLKRIVKEVIDVFQDLGPYCAKIAAIHKRAFIQTKNLDDMENVHTSYMTKALDTALLLFTCQIERIMGPLDETDQHQFFVTDKVKQLLGILKTYDPDDNNSLVSKNETAKLSGLVFVQHRITAQILTWFLEDVSKTPRFRFLKPGFVVGSSSFGTDPAESRITATVQANIIRKFRNKEYNLLVATKVLEEGLDIPACNLVIRFDKIHTYPSYVQSMGRARSKNSRFFAFIDNKEEELQKNQYKCFKDYSNQLSEYLNENAIHPDDEDADFIRTEKVFDQIPNFVPDPQSTVRLTALESISIAQRYCQTLPCDKLATLSPTSWWEQQEDGKYVAYVKFPSNSCIKEVVKGDAQETKTLAKRSAYLEACKLLYHRHALDAKLLPISNKQAAAIKKFLDAHGLENDKGTLVVGSKNRTQWYKKKIPDRILLSVVGPRIQFKIYEIYVEQLQPTEDEVAKRLYCFKERRHVFGLIIPTDLVMIPQFLLNVNPVIGSLVVTLNAITLKEHPNGLTLKEEEIKKLQDFHRYLFGDLLKLKREIMRSTDKSSFLFAPLKRDNNLDHSINWGLVDELLNIPETFFDPPTEEARKNFTYEPHQYEDSMVIPWYRGEQRFFYTVLRIAEDMNPRSVFIYNKQYPDYVAYFTQKYASIKQIYDHNQQLLKAKLISNNLNFFKTDVSYKKNKEERKEARVAIVEHLPELQNRHPIPASLYIQSKLLPSIVQRIHRFLNAFEIQRLVAQDTPWSEVEAEQTSYEEEWQHLTCKYGFVEWRNVSSEKKSKTGDSEAGSDREDDIEIEQIDAAANNGNDTIIQVSQPATTCKSDVILLEEQRQEAEALEKTVSGIPTVQHENMNEEDGAENQPVLDFLHPREISFDQIQRIKDRTKGLGDRDTRIRNLAKNRIAEDDHTYDWQYEKECPIQLPNIDELDITDTLDDKFSFEKEKQPSIYLLMQTITMEASMDCVTLERLETLGDSFLKYCVSRHIYVYFPDSDEGDLTQWRSSLISNRHLYQKGKEFELGKYLAAGIFRPECAWVPPSFEIPAKLAYIAAQNGVNEDVYLNQDTVELEKEDDDQIDAKVQIWKTTMLSNMPPNIAYTYGRVNDKSLADSVEALIGAYFWSGGPGAALHLMKKINLKGPTENKKDRVDFGDWPCPIPNYDEGKIKDDLVENHFPLEELEDILQYKFKHPWLAVEALSHPGYMKNMVTDCYQRLEFLGDAVLDFLITNHIYKMRKMSPGELTDLRSALVNNVTFASLTVRYGFFRYFLHNDRRLQESIEAFVDEQRAAKHEVTGHFNLLSDLDCHLVSDIECPKVLGDIFESIAGAVYIDSGWSLDSCWKVFYRLMKREIELFAKDIPKSPVRELHENNPGRPVFRDITDAAHRVAKSASKLGMFYYALTVQIPDENGESKPIIGVGKTKQNAKLAAAKYYKKLDLLRKRKAGI